MGHVQERQVTLMKKCPHCGVEYGFLRFVGRFGADTLISHPSTLSKTHRREHLCGKCRKLFWLEFNHHEMQLRLSKSVSGLLAWSVVYMLVAVIFLKMSVSSVAGLTAVIAFAGYPVFISWIKYESVHLIAK
ncbi:MAG: hypothetical protein A2Y02_02615 [Omnitrophica bacterium GWA2_52_12]|nr:MAG: hypothetical protein A2Y02_02615 [Omnitrophica bacterium GWA2_52_12]